MNDFCRIKPPVLDRYAVIPEGQGELHCMKIRLKVGYVKSDGGERLKLDSSKSSSLRLKRALMSGLGSQGRPVACIEAASSKTEESNRKLKDKYPNSGASRATARRLSAQNGSRRFSGDHWVCRLRSAPVMSILLFLILGELSLLTE